jgi:hypothetical protein
MILPISASQVGMIADMSHWYPTLKVILGTRYDVVIGRLRQETHEFEASFHYTARLCLKNKQGQKRPLCENEGMYKNIRIGLNQFIFI